MKKIFLMILIGFMLMLCSCKKIEIDTSYYVKDSSTLVYDNLMSLQMDEVKTTESYAKGTFLLGFGTYESKTDYHMYIYITFWYSPIEGAYRKARLIEDKNHCIIIIETEEEHYYIDSTKGFVGGEQYDTIYRVYIPKGTVKVTADFEVE